MDARLEKSLSPVRLTAKHHALLFGWIARAVIDNVGQNRGGEVIRQAVRRYAGQRGRRMALRAAREGRGATVLDYLSYCEWQPDPGESTSSLVRRNPDLRQQVQLCPWFRAWQEAELVDAGRLYCEEIDRALLCGFNPDLELQVASLRVRGDPCCEFIFKEANLSLFDSIRLVYRRRRRSGRVAAQPWDYHLGHLYATLRRVLIEELGPAGAEALHQGLAEFTEHFSAEATQAVLANAERDFEVAL